MTDPRGMVEGNVLHLLRDGREAYPAMLAAIDGARRTAHLETYILRSDRTGQRFGEALARAAGRGVRARLLFDAVGSSGIDRGFLRALSSAGVAIHEYRPIRTRDLLGAFHRRDHRKILAVDGATAFVGGINIGDEYAPAADGGEGWRDNHARVEGPAAGWLDAEFLRVWNRETGERILRAAEPPPRPGGVPARVLANRNLLRRHRIRIAYLGALRRAQQSVEIVNAYFVPDRATRRALRRAAARGVAVRILVPERSDVRLALYASRHLYDRLLRGGVRLFAYRRGILHAKTAVVDGTWCAVGSYNMDDRSLFHNLEINVHAMDARFAGALTESFEEDLLESREIDLAAWRARPARERWMERLAYAVRYWL